MNNSAEFNNLGVTVLRNVVVGPFLDYLQIITNVQEAAMLTTTPPTPENPFPFNDLQAEKSFALYGTYITDSLLLLFKPILEKIVNKPLEMTYSYYRSYYKGADLFRHKDRHSCEYSATFCINKHNTNWPIYFDTHVGTIEIELEEGDLAIYRGCDLFHWRNELLGPRFCQAFVHYIDANSTDAEYYKLDGRVALGLPRGN